MKVSNCMAKLFDSYQIIRMCFSFLFIFILITSQVEAKNSCNDECLTKIYCISSDGSGGCSKNNLVTAQFKVIPVFGQYDYIQLTLKGYNVAPDDQKTIRLEFKISDEFHCTYTCYKSPLGSTNARFDLDAHTVVTGSSSYSDGVLNCTWTFNLYDEIWPMSLDLFKDSSHSITLDDDFQEALVARNTTQLPIYHAQYLKCCNKVHGNDDFVITFDQTDKQIRYRLYFWEYQNEHVIVTLTRKDGIKLTFKCHGAKVVKGYITNGSERISVNKQVTEASVIQGEICSWATPFVLGDSTISIDASTTVFDLRLEVDGVTVYTEKGVTLKNVSHLVKLNFFLIVFVFLLKISFLWL